MTDFHRLTVMLVFLIMCCPTLSSAIGNNNLTLSSDSSDNTIDVANFDKNALEKLTEEEREWYKKFQNGLLFFDGWQQISIDILTSLPPEDKKQASYLLKTIGVKIGTEWSRENSIRKIDNDHLQSWGELLKKARMENAPLLADTLKKIAHEVDAILVE